LSWAKGPLKKLMNGAMLWRSRSVLGAVVVIGVSFPCVLTAASACEPDSARAAAPLA
jgi:hypothetical protein